MSADKPSNKIIMGDSFTLDSYGAKIRLTLDKTDDFAFTDEACFPLNDKESLIRFVRLKPPNPFTGKIHNKFEVYLESFSTSSEAEQKGVKLSIAFLWAAISRNYPLRLESNSALPCIVYNGTQVSNYKSGISATSTVKMSIERLAESVNEVFSASIPVDEQLLVSMELFTGAKLEATERSRFVRLVSSLEPLAERSSYDIPDLELLVDKFINELKSNTFVIDRQIRDSVIGRAKELKQESIKQAIKRLVKEKLPNEPHTVRTVSEAYDIRSKILHEGSTDIDFQAKGQQIEKTIRKIYAKMLGLSLYAK